MIIFIVYCILVSQGKRGRKTKATGINIDNYNLFIIFVEYISECETEEDREEDKVKSAVKGNYV